MNKIKIGFIGVGSMAAKHIEVINKIEGMAVVGVTSRTQAHREAFAAQHNIEVCADSVESLIKKAKPDALMVLVSEDQIFPVASAVIPYGLPLFIEKPAGMSPEENLKLLDLARKYSVRTMVGFNRRYYSIFHKGLKIIRDNGPLLGVMVEGHERFWRIREAKRFSEEILAQWIFVNSIHVIDLLRFFGGEPSQVMSVSHSFREAHGDQFAAIMKLDSGALGQYNAHWYSPGGWRVVLYGQGVTVEFKPLEVGHWIDKNFQSHEILADDVDAQFKPGFYAQMKAFEKFIPSGLIEWPLQDLEGSYKSMALAGQLANNLS